MVQRLQCKTIYDKKIFEKWINWKLGLSKYFGRAAADVPEIEYQYFVLIHGDLSPRNLILDADNRVWLIDWGCAGIYPPIFEAASAKHQVQFPTFAQLLLPLIYNNADELAQIESCSQGSYGINRAVFSLPPEMAPAHGTNP
jgi:thiamine kinase-like enzyme